MYMTAIEMLTALKALGKLSKEDEKLLEQLKQAKK